MEEATDPNHAAPLGYPAGSTYEVSMPPRVTETMITIDEAVSKRTLVFTVASAVVVVNQLLGLIPNVSPASDAVVLALLGLAGGAVASLTHRPSGTMKVKS